MDQIGVLHPAGLTGRDDDLAGPLEVRIGLQAHREGDVFEDRGLQVSDPGDPDDVARREAVAERPVDQIERAKRDASRREKVGHRSADGPGGDLLAAVDERHRQAAIECQALTRNDARLDRRRKAISCARREPEPAECVRHRF